jgi:hypothetical protein
MKKITVLIIALLIILSACSPTKTSVAPPPSPLEPIFPKPTPGDVEQVEFDDVLKYYLPRVASDSSFQEIQVPDEEFIEMLDINRFIVSRDTQELPDTYEEWNLYYPVSKEYGILNTITNHYEKITQTRAFEPEFAESIQDTGYYNYLIRYVDSRYIVVLESPENMGFTPVHCALRLIDTQAKTDIEVFKYYDPDWDPDSNLINTSIAWNSIAILSGILWFDATINDSTLYSYEIASGKLSEVENAKNPLVIGGEIWAFTRNLEIPDAQYNILKCLKTGETIEYNGQFGVLSVCQDKIFSTRISQATGILGIYEIASHIPITESSGGNLITVLRGGSGYLWWETTLAHQPFALYDSSVNGFVVFHQYPLSIGQVYSSEETILVHLIEMNSKGEPTGKETWLTQK